jgi:ankyrin repeat protein
MMTKQELEDLWDTVYETLKIKDFDKVKQYIDSGFDITMYDNNLLKACAELNYIEAVNFLIYHGADVDAEKSMALYYSADRNHFEVVKVLLEAGANVEASNVLNNKNVNLQIKDWCRMFDKTRKLSNNLDNTLNNKEAVNVNYKRKL